MSTDSYSVSEVQLGSREALSLGMETELPNSLPGDDQDECLLLPGELCQHLCINTVGSYHCACFPGFSLQDDGRTCRPGKHLDSPGLGPGLVLPGIVAFQQWGLRGTSPATPHIGTCRIRGPLVVGFVRPGRQAPLQNCLQGTT